ncbi:hypothetical protein AC1031_012826 [Aphanomyces cochlioides]|nr:hypothetical protein AC1031_012826 [Aphanomyces cochlioides]
MALWFIILWSCSALVYGQTASLSLENPKAGAVTLVDVFLTTTLAIPVGGAIRITFPLGFQVAPTALTSPVGLSASSTVSYTGLIAKIDIVGTPVAVGSVSFTINGISNPGVGSTAVFSVDTYDAANGPLDTMSAGSVSIAANSPLVASLVTNTTAGSTSPWVVSLTTALTLPPSSSIRVSFPSRFTVTTNLAYKLVGFNATTTTTTTVGNTVRVTLNMFALPPGTYSFTLSGIISPGSSCNQFYDEICTTPFENHDVSTNDVNGNVYQTVSLAGTPLIKSYMYFGRVRTALTTHNTVTSAQVTINTVTAIPSGGHVLVDFPLGYSFAAGGTASLGSAFPPGTTAAYSGLKFILTVCCVPIPPQNDVQFAVNSITTPPLHTVGSYSITTTDAQNNVLEQTTTVGGEGCAELNDCSGHGDCTLMSKTCLCYPGWGAASDIAEYKAPDCSQRTCPSDYAWADIPTAPTMDHQTILECSGKGLCDRKTGLCQCLPGFEGSACNRMSCPNDCSGHGQCLSLSQMATTASAMPLLPSTTYSSWDANRIFGCVCDSSWPVGLGNGQTRVAEWFGVDCSLRHCPSGDDPLTTKDETDCSGVAAPGGTTGAAGNRCFVECSNRGICYFQQGTCRCNSGFYGAACNYQDALYQERPMSLVEVALSGY